jgi:small GTP-binding protein
VLLLGDQTAEKSAFTKRYCYNIFNPSERLTIGVDFHVKTIDLHGKNIKLQIWDVGGEERFRFLLPTYCLGANAAFLLYDVTRSQTLDNIGEWINIVHQKGGDIPIMLIGTNLDLAEDNREVPREYGIEVAKKNELSAFAEVSAKTGQNVDKAFKKLAELTLKRIEGRDYNQSDETPYKYAEEDVFDEEFVPIDYIDEFAYESQFNISNAEFIETHLINPDFEINDHLSLRLENNKTNIYVGGRLFSQCKYLLLDISKGKNTELKKIDSIDEAEAKLDKRMENDHSIITSKTEFWGHCSNLQAWYENSYDTRILHRNIAFPLLRELVKEGDILARKVFKQEVAKRLESGYPSVVLYLIEEDYLNCLSYEELDAVLSNPRFLKNLLKWFRNDIPEDLTKRIMEKLNNLHCPYCGCKVENSLSQKTFNGKGIRCMYCFTCIIKDA